MSIKKNFAFNSLLNLSNLIFPIFTVPYVSRVLGVESIGLANFIITFTTYFILIANLGTPLYGVREISKCRDNSDAIKKTFNEIFSINIVSGVVCSIVFFVIITTFNLFKEHFTLYFISSMGVVFSFLNFDWFYSGQENFKIITIRSLVVKGINLLLLFVFVKNSDDVNIYLLLYFLSNFLNQIWNLITLRRYNVSIKFTLNNWTNHIKPLFTFLISTLAIQVYLLMDTLIIGFLKDYVQVGLYSSAIKAVRLVMPIITSLGVVLLPRISAMKSADDKEGLTLLLNKSFEVVCFLSIPISIFFMFVASRFVPWFFGTGYDKAVLPMQLLSLIIIIGNFSYFFSVQILAMLGKEKVYLISVLLGMMVNVVFNFLFIPKFNIEGAAIASILGEITVTGIGIYFVSNKLRIKINFSDAIKAFISSLGMGFLYLLLINTELSNFEFIFVFSICAVFSYLSIQYFIFRNQIVHNFTLIVRNFIGNKEN